MARCWAQCLGDCDGKRSQEHYVSANILGSGPIKVRGLDWCRDEYKQISAASFTRSMLCKRHNERLSPLDQAGGAAWMQLRVFAASAKRSALMPPNARAVSLRVEAIDGPMFERWLLKVVTNITYGRGDEGDRWTPAIEWVEIIFGLREFPDRCGLYLETVPREARMSTDQYFAAQILTYPGTQVPCGGQMKVNEWGLIVTLTPLLEKGVQYRPKFLKLHHRRKLFRVLRFDW